MDLRSSSNTSKVDKFIFRIYPYIKKRGLYLVGIVSSWSMAPLLVPGVKIYFIPCNPLNLKKGDIICFIGKKFMAHRLINIDNGRFITKGDNNTWAEKPISSGKILGKVTQIKVNDKNIIDLESKRSQLIAKIFNWHSILVNKLPFLLKIIRGRRLLLKLTYGKNVY